MKLSTEQLSELARLAERREYAVLLGWLSEESVRLTRTAVTTADAHTCGAATQLQDLVTTLSTVQELYRQTTKTGNGSSIF